MVLIYMLSFAAGMYKRWPLSRNIANVLLNMDKNILSPKDVS